MRHPPYGLCPAPVALWVRACDSARIRRASRSSRPSQTSGWLAPRRLAAGGSWRRAGEVFGIPIDADAEALFVIVYRYSDRFSAACAAHARRNFEELTHDGTSLVGLEAVRRFARIYGVEAALKDLTDDERRSQRQRQRLAKPLWEELQ